MAKGIDLTGQKFGNLVAIDYFTKGGRRYWNCQCDCGEKAVAIASSLRNGTRVSCGCRGKYQFNLVGKRFGKLAVIERLEKHTKSRAIYYKCICDCGKEKIALSKNLHEGKTNNCGCETIARLSISRRKGYGQALRNRVVGSYKSGAKRKGREFKLTDEELNKLFKGNCYYCGTKPSTTISNVKHFGEFTYNGIDRINSNKGYVIDNVVSCCKVCNYMKNDSSLEQFLKSIKKIAENMRL